MLKVSAVKKYVKAHKKQISKDALQELAVRVQLILDSAIKLTNSHKRITKVEIEHAGR